jgi:hypothetical protein
MNQDISYLESLPGELLEKVLENISDQEIFNICATSKTLKLLCSDDSYHFWSQRLRREYPNLKSEKPYTLYRILKGFGVGLKIAGITLTEKFRGKLNDTYRGRGDDGNFYCFRFICADKYTDYGICNIVELDVFKVFEYALTKNPQYQKYLLLPEILYPQQTGLELITLVYPDASPVGPDTSKLRGEDVILAAASALNIVRTGALLHSAGFYHNNIYEGVILWRRVTLDTDDLPISITRKKTFQIPCIYDFSTASYIDHYRRPKNIVYPPPEGFRPLSSFSPSDADSWAVGVTVARILGMNLYPNYLEDIKETKLGRDDLKDFPYLLGI